MLDVPKGKAQVIIHQLSPEIFGYTASLTPLIPTKLVTRSLAYQHDLVSQDKLLMRFTGSWISFTSDEATYQGKLLRVDETHIFLQPDTLNPSLLVVERRGLREMFYPQLPSGLVTEPTLVWDVASSETYRQLPVELSYLTTGLSWRCDYEAVMEENSLILGAYFTIYNDLPIAFPDAVTTLVVGRPHQREEASDIPQWEASWMPSETKPASIMKPIDEYATYRLPDPIDVEPLQTLRIPYREYKPKSFRREFRVPHRYGSEEVETFIVCLWDTSFFPRSIPQGSVNFFRREKEGNRLFLGQDVVPLTPAGQELELKLTATPQLKATRTRIPTQPSLPPQRREFYEVKIFSSRQDTVTVWVEQRIFGTPRAIEASWAGKPVSAKVISAERCLFPVLVPPHSEQTLTIHLIYD